MTIKYIFIMLAIFCPFLTQAVDLQFKGNLLTDACTVKAGDENLQVAMRTVSDKDLYDNPRSSATAFQIHLEDCDTDVASSVKVNFTGTESTELEGYLAVSGTDGSKGFAIGIETPTGVLVKLNDNTSAHQLTLQTGNNTIALQAFLQAEPAFIAAQSIELGAYTVVTTFQLEYE